VPVAALGILGGTFNPPHLGHLALARYALGELGLDRVLLMPACLSPFKRSEEDPGPEHRLRMCRLAIEDDRARHPGAAADELAACSLEIQRGGVSYTVDTLRAIHAAHPDAQLTLIVGADVARTLPTWREPRELLALADFAVALRTGAEHDDRSGAPTGLGDDLRPAGLLPDRSLGEHPRLLDMPAIDVSSSQVRDRVRHGAPVEDLVGPAVASYIAEHDLYSRPVWAGAS
jgi:nicotinate-nucleotide adenylyltransferase